MQPVLFYAFGIPVGSYGFFLTLGHLAGIAALFLIARKEGLPLAPYLDVALSVVLLGAVGARLGYALTHWNEFRDHPPGLLSLSRGGMSFFGGAILAFFGFLIVARWRKIPFLAASDLLCPSLPFSLGLVRIGCFLKGCCYGTETAFPLGVVYTRLDSKVPQALLDRHLHPSQLYEAAFLFLLALGLALAQRRNRMPPGFLATFSVFSYCLFRLSFDFLRGDLERGFLGVSWMSSTQAAALLGIAASPVVLWICLKACATKQARLS